MPQTIRTPEDILRATGRDLYLIQFHDAWKGLRPDTDEGSDKGSDEEGNALSEEEREAAYLDSFLDRTDDPAGRDEIWKVLHAVLH